MKKTKETDPETIIEAFLKKQLKTLKN